MTNADGPVPRLRFPEFRDAGPWEVKRLGEVADCYQPETISVPSTSEGGKFPVFGANGIIGYFDRYNHEESEIIIGCRGQCGNVLLTLPKSWINGNSMVIKPLRAKYIDKNFLFHQIYSSNLDYLITGSAQPQITSEIKRHPVFLPSQAEQDKIAHCLSSLDDLIRAEGERLEALKAHKRGLMQQLFPRPGETTPRLRFPEFHDAGPWEVKRLGDEETADFVRDRIAPEDIPLGHYVSTINLLSDFNGLAKRPETPPSGSAIAYRAGDILMSNIRPYLRKIWVADRSGGASNDVIVARPGKKIVPAFLGHFLMSDRFISYIMDGAKGLKMPRGDLEQIQGFDVPRPSRLEQQKIADCLTSLDDLIRAEGERLEALKAHKRGLMQQLFPQSAA